jgi:hypothetical protein
MLRKQLWAAENWLSSSLGFWGRGYKYQLLTTNNHIVSNVTQDTGLEENIGEGKRPLVRP